MNKIDVVVAEVVIAPHQREDGLWSTTVMIDGWGGKYNKTITEDKKWKVEMYEVGHRWQE